MRGPQASILIRRKRPSPVDLKDAAYKGAKRTGLKSLPGTTTRRPAKAMSQAHAARRPDWTPQGKASDRNA